MNILSDVARKWPELAAELERRPLPVPVPDQAGTPLSPAVTVLDVDGPVDGDRMLREWHDRTTAQDLQDALHGMDVERAAQPPVVTVTPPQGTAVVHIQAGPPVAAADAITLSEEREQVHRVPVTADAPPRRNVVSATWALRRRLRLARLLGQP